MRIKRAFVLLCLGTALAVLALGVFNQPAAVLAQQATCVPGVPCTPPPSGGNKPKKTATTVYIFRPTKTATPTETQVPTDTATPLPADTATPTEAAATVTETAKPSDILLPVKTAGPPATPPSVLSPPAPACFFCDLSWLGLLLGGGLLLALLAGLLFLIFRRPLSLGSAGLAGGGDPFPGSNENATIRPGGADNMTITTNEFGGPVSGLDRGGVSNFTMTVDQGSEFGGGPESATMTVHDAGDISPDGANPGGANLDLKGGAGGNLPGK